MARGRDRWLLALVPAFIGGPFVLGGSLVLSLVPAAVDRAIADIQAARPVTVATLGMMGTDVVLEGEIHDRTPTVYNNLVAYDLSEPVMEDGELTWKHRQGETPDLWLALPDGLVLLEAGYALGRTSQVLTVSSDRRYSGIQVGDEVLVLGQVRAVAGEDQPPRIAARLVSVDNRDSYLVTLTTEKQIFQAMGLIFLILGGGLLLVSGVCCYRGRSLG
jgi:hypothetical protein